MEKFTYYFWIFMIGSFLGVIIETIWCIIKYKKFESRKGLIFGPFNPLYGCATVLLTFAINSTKYQTTGNVFLIGVVVASIVEYACSFIQEKFFGTTSWDYKDFKYNLKGRINLMYSLIWGFLTLLWFKEFMPVIDNLMLFFYEQKIITVLALIFMAFDIIISFLASIRRYMRQQNKYPQTKLGKHIDYIYNDEVMERVYPNSVFTDNQKTSGN